MAAQRGGGVFAPLGAGFSRKLVFRTLLILGILVPGTYLAVRNRYFALLMYLWFALFRPQDWLWIDITPLRLSVVYGAILVVPALVASIYPNVSHPISVGMILFFGTTVLAQVNAVRPDIGWTWVDFLLRLFVACLMLTTLAADVRRLYGVIAVLACSLGVHAAKAGLAYALGGGMRFADGLAGAFVDNNGYALGTVMIMPLLLATAQNLEVLYRGRLVPYLRVGLYGSILLCTLAVIGTFSRGGFLALSIGVLTLALLQRRRSKSLTAVLVLVGVFLLVVPIPQSYLDRVQTIRTYEEIGDDSALSRPHFWYVGVLMAADHPFGIGLRQYELLYDRYDFLHGRYGRGRAVHSAHVQVLAESGYLGAAIWAALFAYATWLCLRIRAQSYDEALAPTDRHFLFTASNALLTSMVSFVVGGAFLSLALNDLTWLTFAMVAALDLLARRLREAAERPAAGASARDLNPFRAVPSYAKGAVA